MTTSYLTLATLSTIIDKMTILDLNGNLKALLLDRYQWYEEALLDELVRRGGPPLSTSQARVLAVLKGESCSISALARELNISRQAAHKTVAKLVEMDWLTLEEGDRKNEKMIIHTEHGHAMRIIVGKSMRAVENKITRKIGKENYSTLVKALKEDWD